MDVLSVEVLSQTSAMWSQQVENSCVELCGPSAGSWERTRLVEERHINRLIRNLKFYSFMLFEVQNYIFDMIKLSNMPQGKSVYYVLKPLNKPLNINERNMYANVISR